MELDDTDHALGDLTLKKSVGSKNISWSTGDHPGISETGTLMEPMYPAAAITAEITAVVTFKNGSTKSFTFTVIVPPMPVDNQIAVNEAADALLIYYTAGDNAGSVTNDITLKANGLHATSISWDTSGNSAVASDGSVTRPSYSSGDSNGSIIATITKGGASTTKSFSLTVVKNAIDDATAVSEAATSLAIGYASGDSASSVTSNISLPASGLHSTSVSWNTSGNSAIGPDGSVARPGFSSGDTTGSLVATIMKGSSSVTKTFSLTVIKLSPTSTEKAQADANALTIIYASGDSASSVTENIGLPSSAGSYGSSISWSTSGHTAINGSGVLSISSSDWGGAPTGGLRRQYPKAVP